MRIEDDSSDEIEGVRQDLFVGADLLIAIPQWRVVDYALDRNAVSDNDEVGVVSHDDLLSVLV